MADHSSKTQDVFNFAKQVLVGGVSGSARLNAALGRPLILTHGDGCRLTDVDGRTYIDYNLSHGATFLGHNHPGIRKAIQQALDMGVICAYETEYHSRLAAKICEIIPCAEQVRFANSGTEATLAALRLAPSPAGKSSSNSRGISTGCTITWSGTHTASPATSSPRIPTFPMKWIRPAFRRRSRSMSW